MIKAIASNFQGPIIKLYLDFFYGYFNVIGERWILSTPSMYPTIDAIIDVATVNSFLLRVKACHSARIDLASNADFNTIRYTFFIGKTGSHISAI